MPLPYLLHVNSRPQPDSGVDDKLWEKWYITEHVGTSLAVWASIETVPPQFILTKDISYQTS